MSVSPAFLATAIDAVVRAGDMQMARFGTAMRVDRKSAIDIVTEVDVAIEHMFRALIDARFPDHDVLAEELGAGTRPDATHRWIFDPIDGTTNFAHGVPIFCASLALEIDGQVEVGAVYDPNRRELFTAERGVGAWLNGAPLRVSPSASMIEGLLVTGFPYNVHEELDEVVALFRDFVGQARAIRRLGSAAIDLCWLAAGRMDGFWEAGLKPWDAAAAALLVTEAGGRVTAFDGAPWAPASPTIVASNGLLHDRMLETLAAARARSPKRTI
ncbi:MAG: inositol monophosphatase family protein [Vicinamibacterales bacterium]|nr:inositol monophosphatase family protein [Vicinamibacterales bacterium]